MFIAGADSLIWVSDLSALRGRTREEKHSKFFAASGVKTNSSAALHLLMRQPDLADKRLAAFAFKDGLEPGEPVKHPYAYRTGRVMRSRFSRPLRALCPMP